MNNIFKVKENKNLVREQKLNLESPAWNQATLGANSLKVPEPKLWNSLPF